MKDQKKIHPPTKQGLHPRNRHKSRYDFKKLKKSFPALEPFVSVNEWNEEGIDFFNAQAVKALNQAILKDFYNISYWDIPSGYLCPPIPGRADYIHHIADLLSLKNKDRTIPRGENVHVLDVGTGANCVYPLLGHREYEWSFVASDIDELSIRSAGEIIDANHLSKFIKLRQQKNKENIFAGIILENEYFDVTMCNPPFHASAHEARLGSTKKIKNLNAKKEKRNPNVKNFGGVSNELWCEGGEVQFITRMIKESIDFKNNCFWFSTLVSKYTNLPPIYEELKKAGVWDLRTIDMSQGQKRSRIVAWTFNRH